MIVLEACVDSVESAAASVAAGAHRIELCANLVEGGTTPSVGTIERAVDDIGADVMVMIRPRGGDFVYGRHELAVMERDIEAAQAARAAGVVFGCLTPDGEVDRDAVRTLLQEARPLPVTFHRAFDVCRDPHEALESLIDLGVDRVLTSGQCPSAPEGLDLIAELVAAAGSRIVVMPGVGIDAGNIMRIATATRAREFHIYTERPRASAMRFRRGDIPMGRSYEPDEYVLLEPDPEEIGAMARALKQQPPP
jgi:copper homeostasis protein